VVESVGNVWLWGGFLTVVLGLLALDLGVFHRQAHEVKFKEAAAWSVFWISLALLFNLFVWRWFGPKAGVEFLTGYLVEKALSVDNIFVFLVIFSAFSVPAAYQHRVLFWGILGALVMRAIFIFAGAALLGAFHWLIYVFGAFLIFTGVKLLLRKDEEVHPERNPLFRLFRRFVPATSQYHGQKFWIRENGKWIATPLFLVLLAVEATDVVFAVDSIPAIFAITRDPFLVFTSNVMAILGLRALFFCLSGVMGMFHHLKFGLSGVLVFVGGKMLLADVYKVPVMASLTVIATLLLGSVVASLLWPKSNPQAAALPKAAS
jgi:tellurite resistance protein TerC